MRKFLSLVALCVATPLLAQDTDIEQQRRTKIASEAEAAISGLSPKAEQACTSTPIVCPYTGGGTLSSTSCIHTYSDPSLNSYLDYYTFQATTGQTIVATMDSSVFATYMSLENSAGTTVAFDTRGSGNSVSVTYTVPVAGTYTILAEALYGIADSVPHSGPYTLSVTGCVGTGGGGGGDGGGACGSTTVNCLNNNRFKVSVTWNANGTNGTGKAVRLTDDTGYFWFFSDTNVELVVKVLDGRTINNHFWVFYGALSNVQYTITVYDTTTGTSKNYTNPSGQLASVADTSAF